VPTSQLETAAAPAAHDPLGIGVAQESPNRRLAWAGGVSGAVHLLFFLAIGIASVDSMRPSSAPELRVYVESQDRGQDDEHDKAGPAAEPGAPAAGSSEELLSAAAVNRPADARSMPRTIASGAPAPQVAPIPQSAPALPVEPTPQAAPSADDSGAGAGASDAPSESVAVLTTTGASASEAPASAAPAARPASVGIPAAQRSLLSRWVMQAAQKLRDVNLRQARLSLQHEGREYVALLERRPAADNMDIERVIVEISTAENGRRLRTRLELKRLAFSHFAQLVDQWDAGVQFHDDEIGGRFHSNSRISVGYDRAVAPRFLRLVTTAVAQGFTLATVEGYRQKDEIFRGGLGTRAGYIALPRIVSPPVSDPDGAGSQRAPFEHDTRITFYRDGSYGWRKLGSDGPEQREALGTPAYIVAARHATLYVRGIVRGQVLVYSPSRIVIEGSLTYAHDPRLSADADDYLGLLSGRDVEIAAPAVTGPGDLEIHAAVYARRRFVVTDEDAPRNGTLVIYGSLTAGSLSATEPRYATRYEFDRRFEHRRPPGFPMTDRYEIESWDTGWQELDDEPSGELADGAGPPSSG
jgi:hypothetical protein